MSALDRGLELARLCVDHEAGDDAERELEELRAALAASRALAKLQPEQLAAALGAPAGTPWPVLLERAHCAEEAIAEVSAQASGAGNRAAMCAAIDAWRAVAGR